MYSSKAKLFVINCILCYNDAIYEVYVTLNFNKASLLKAGLGLQEEYGTVRKKEHRVSVP